MTNFFSGSFRATAIKVFVSVSIFFYANILFCQAEQSKFDGLVKSQLLRLFVLPAKDGIQ